MSLVSQLAAGGPRDFAEEAFLPQASLRTSVSAGPGEIVALAASYRHAVLNELQVLLGWAQLGNVERVLAFISGLRAAYHAENDLCRWADKETAALFLLRRAVAVTCLVDVECRVELRAPFRVPAPDRAVVADLVDALLSWMPGNAGSGPLLVTIGHDGPSLHVTCLLPQGGAVSLAEASKALARLRPDGMGLIDRIALFRARGGECSEVQVEGRHGFRLLWPAAAGACS